MIFSDEEEENSKTTNSIIKIQTKKTRVMVQKKRKEHYRVLINCKAA